MSEIGGPIPPQGSPRRNRLTESVGRMTVAATNVLQNRRGFFICYRRRDSAGVAGRIRDRLVAEFGEEHVFFDVDGIMPGANFLEAVRERVGKVAVVLLVIGPGWKVDPAESTTMERMNPTDIVRLEAATALASGAEVLPVVVDGGRVPPPESLPPKLKKLAYVNAIEVRHTKFDRDIEDLIDLLRPISGINRRAWWTGVITSAVILGGGLVWAAITILR